MFAPYAVMFTTPCLGIRKTALRQEQLSMICPMIGFARSAALARKTLKPVNK